jgi:hypothetical protein
MAEEAIPYALELSRLSGGTIALTRIVPSAVEPPAKYSMTEVEPWFIRQHQMYEKAEAYLTRIAVHPDLVAAHPRVHVAAGELIHYLQFRLSTIAQVN